MDESKFLGLNAMQWAWLIGPTVLGAFAIYLNHLFWNAVGAAIKGALHVQWAKDDAERLSAQRHERQTKP